MLNADCSACARKARRANVRLWFRFGGGLGYFEAAKNVIVNKLVACFVCCFFGVINSNDMRSTRKSADAIK